MTTQDNYHRTYTFHLDNDSKEIWVRDPDGNHIATTHGGSTGLAADAGHNIVQAMNSQLPRWVTTNIKDDASCFQDINEARDYAVKNVRGFPAWRVVDSGVGPIIELNPTTPTYLQRQR